MDFDCREDYSDYSNSDTECAVNEWRWKDEHFEVSESNDSLDDFLRLVKINSRLLGVLHIRSCTWDVCHTIDIFHNSTNTTRKINDDSNPEFKFEIKSKPECMPRSKWAVDIFSKILKALADNSSVIEFNFSCVDAITASKISPELLSMLAKNSSIQRIFIEDIKFDQECTISLFEQISSKPYTSISLCGFDLNSHNLEIFFRSPVTNKSLQSLCLKKDNKKNEIIHERDPQLVQLLVKYLPLFTELEILTLYLGISYIEELDLDIANSLRDNFNLTKLYFPFLSYMPNCDDLILRNKENKK